MGQETGEEKSMANYIAFARTNYFKVRDVEAFEKVAGKIEVEIIESGDGDDTLYGLIWLGEGGWPNDLYDEDAGEYEPFDLYDEIGAVLAPGEVAIFMEIGYEKMRYLTGYAIAVHSSGEWTRIGLEDIYVQARNQFHLEHFPSRVEY